MTSHELFVPCDVLFLKVTLKEPDTGLDAADTRMTSRDSCWSPLCWTKWAARLSAVVLPELCSATDILMYTLHTCYVQLYIIQVHNVYRHSTTDILMYGLHTSRVLYRLSQYMCTDTVPQTYSCTHYTRVKLYTHVYMCTCVQTYSYTYYIRHTYNCTLCLSTNMYKHSV